MNATPSTEQLAASERCVLSFLMRPETQEPLPPLLRSILDNPHSFDDACHSAIGKAINRHLAQGRACTPDLLLPSLEEDAPPGTALLLSILPDVAAGLSFEMIEPIEGRPPTDLSELSEKPVIAVE